MSQYMRQIATFSPYFPFMIHPINTTRHYDERRFTMKLKKWLVGGLAVCVFLMGFAAVVPATFADGLGEDALQALGITEEEYEAAKETARVTAIEEAAVAGWITDDEAEELIDNGRSLRLGRGWYYEGIIDKKEHLADAVGVAVSELEGAEAAAYEARLAEDVDNGRLTEEEAADKQAAHDFKQSLDKDTLLADALGISVADLNNARADNMSFEDLLDDLDLTEEEAQEAAQETAVQQAVDNGTLTAEQAEEILEHGGCGGGRGDKRGGRGQERSDSDAPSADAGNNA